MEGRMHTASITGLRNHLEAASLYMAWARQELEAALSLVEGNWRRQTLPLGPEGLFWNYLKMAVEGADRQSASAQASLAELCQRLACVE